MKNNSINRLSSCCKAASIIDITEDNFGICLLCKNPAFFIDDKKNNLDGEVKDLTTIKLRQETGFWEDIEYEEE